MGKFTDIEHLWFQARKQLWFWLSRLKKFDIHTYFTKKNYNLYTYIFIKCTLSLLGIQIRKSNTNMNMECLFLQPIQTNFWFFGFEFLICTWSITITYIFYYFSFSTSTKQPINFHNPQSGHRETSRINGFLDILFQHVTILKDLFGWRIPRSQRVGLRTPWVANPLAFF